VAKGWPKFSPFDWALTIYAALEGDWDDRAAFKKGMEAVIFPFQVRAAFSGPSDPKAETEEISLKEMMHRHRSFELGAYLAEFHIRTAFEPLVIRGEKNKDDTSKGVHATNAARAKKSWIGGALLGSWRC